MSEYNSVRCVRRGSGHLTDGKVYDIVAVTNNNICVVNDNGKYAIYERSRFEYLDQPKFKVGDKVKVIKSRGFHGGTRVFYEVGDVFEIKKFGTYHVDIVYGLDGRAVDLEFDVIELVDDKPFTQQDLEVGMYVSSTVQKDLTHITYEMQRDNGRRGSMLTAIFKENDNGDLIKMWERPKDKLYTLALPNNDGLGRFYNQNKSDERVYIFDNSTGDQEIWQYHFNQKEINDLPNQDLIKSLDQVEVE